MARPVLLAGYRSPMVRAGAEFRSVPAKELARRVVQELLDSSGVAPAEINEIILGNAGTPADAPNIARVAGLMAGLPESVPGYTVHRNCASGLEAIIQAADRIVCGSADLIVAGGVENMSRIPMQLPPEANNWFARWARAKTFADRVRALLSIRPRTMLPESALIRGLEDPVCGLSMGMTAENLAREFGITRQEQDEFALESHQRASAARSAGIFESEIVPVFVGPKFDTMVTQDIGPRENQSLEALGKLRPVFDREHGTVTAGNSCMITDGAAAVLIASEERARSLGFHPLAAIRSHATVGLSPARMGLGPALAIPAALDRARLALSDVGRFEINEAFAAQVLACLRAMASGEFARRELGRSQAVGEIDRRRLNPRGGAIALGHPIGATGARLIVTLMGEMQRSAEGIGVAALCVGGGQGSAIVLERMS